MNGYSDGTFKPDASITRAEFSAVMARFLKLDDKTSAAEKFGDVKRSLGDRLYRRSCR